ncbi:uncharacterized protein BJ212DRAFT_347510 [Suillus subaureus]|uniref:Hydrophobin n=1 Tax=Suillus subaureus TaxID=48587 RepID=A0A9P7E968_9AGAM|nr:uncharacterized protein BJ212DRAFT_347510 [Suillus subaureus]KAG1814693.1 hypothetical protein BJ212DRAFT_347510 [Suillus subaureus]
MRFSFFAIIVASATSIMSVSACVSQNQLCQTTEDCCPGDYLGCTTIVSRSTLLRIESSPDHSPFALCNISRRVSESASTTRRVLDMVAVGTIGGHNFASAKYV